MAISITWGTKVIFVPKADTTLVQLTPFEVRSLDVNAFRLELKALEASVDGMPFPITHVHNTEYVISGVTYSRSVEIINGYTVEFEDGLYGVSLEGANNNILDVKVANQVSLLVNNSGGLINSDAINDQSYLGAQVYINIALGSIGTLYPKGTPPDPVNNWSDAFVIATTRNFQGIHLRGSLDFSAQSLDPMSLFEFMGSSPITSLIILDGRDTTGCTFELCGITGTANGKASYRRCNIGGLSGFFGIATDCGVDGNLTLDSTANENMLFKNCVSIIAGNSRAILDCNDTLADIHFRNYSGGLTVSNFTSGNNMSLDVNQGTIEIDSSCTAGEILVRGIVKLIDNSGPGCTVITEGTVSELTNAEDSRQANIWAKKTHDIAHQTNLAIENNI